MIFRTRSSRRSDELYCPAIWLGRLIPPSSRFACRRRLIAVSLARRAGASRVAAKSRVPSSRRGSAWTSGTSFQRPVVSRCWSADDDPNRKPYASLRKLLTQLAGRRANNPRRHRRRSDEGCVYWQAASRRRRSSRSLQSDTREHYGVSDHFGLCRHAALPRRAPRGRSNRSLLRVAGDGRQDFKRSAWLHRTSDWPVTALRSRRSITLSGSGSRSRSTFVNVEAWNRHTSRSILATGPVTCVASLEGTFRVDPAHCRWLRDIAARLVH